MVDRQIHERIFRRRQHLTQLAQPVVPRIASPRIVGPQESALLRYARSARPLRGEKRAAVIGDRDERAFEQLGLGRLNDDVVGCAVFVEIDRGFGELRQPNRQVLVGARIVDAPSAAVSPVPARNAMRQNVKSPLNVSAVGPADAV